MLLPSPTFVILLTLAFTPASLQKALQITKFPEAQQELIERYPGSLIAVARALKMTIVECQYQMRHEPWNCPVYGFSIKPTEMFGNLMSRNFKETSFIHALLSSAIAHSIARACTESIIATCGGKNTRDGGYMEDIEFGLHFAQQFMEATHELAATPSALLSSSSSSSSIALVGSPGNSTGSADGSNNNEVMVQPHQHQQLATSGHMMGTSRKERKIRNLINAHNDEAGRLYVFNGMRRECKCHGLSGACSMQTCWLKLPPFREVASKLHDRLDQAIQVTEVLHSPSKYKSLTSTSMKKSNKKRSSMQPKPDAIGAGIGGLPRSSAFSSQGSPSSPSPSNHHQVISYPHEPSSINSLTSDNTATTNIIGSRQQRKAAASESAAAAAAGTQESSTGIGDQSMADVGTANNNNVVGAGGGGSSWNSLSAPSAATPMEARNTTVVKKRPVARSIGTNAYKMSLDKLDLIYFETSPDFCLPNERYNIKGTKGRICSESQNAVNSCKTLCCGRGYKTEYREEKYKCECQFKFCCELNCNTCTRRKVIHRCL